MVSRVATLDQSAVEYVVFEACGAVACAVKIRLVTRNGTPLAGLVELTDYHIESVEMDAGAARRC